MNETTVKTTETAAEPIASLASVEEPRDGALDLERIKFDPRWAMRVAPGLMIRRRFLPLLELNGRLYVAVEKTLDSGSRRLLERLSSMSVETVAATGASIRSLQAKLFGDLREAISMDRPAIDAAAALRADNSEPSSDEAVEIFDQILKGGIVRGASDIHFNVKRGGDVQVRLRIDGALIDDLDLPEALRNSLFNRIKVMADLDISEKRASQDGSFRFDPGPNLPNIEVRVATIPARHGERITLRLLTKNESLLTLSGLGFETNHRKVFERAITLSHGMILLTGPTGSGKSTTLYAGLKYLMERKSVNAMTVEDPIEYEIEGVTQTEVDARQEKVSFASSLRSILRHDPDVVMLGEIRDRETAELAVRASLTGHLVLSTLHTNTAAGAVTRLIDLGVDRFLISSVLRLVAAQRLVRRLCPHCSQENKISAMEARSLRNPELAGESCMRPAGCLICAGTGYSGRSGLYEVLPIGPEEADAIGGRDSTESLESMLRKSGQDKGHASLRANGIEKIINGE
ncbi:MAG: type II/IV secretion system protein, partial [Verrucomicrobiales bacterium]|nr:type II/IV secretion system protein [Verrucomicrobiales bacterium]